jgi:hypothetical protein
MFDKKKWKKTKNIGKSSQYYLLWNSRILNWINFVTELYSNPTVFFKIVKNLKSAFVVGANMWINKPNVTDYVSVLFFQYNTCFIYDMSSMFYR